MAMAAKPISKPLSMANTCIIPSPSIFNTRASLQQISIPFKPIKLHLSTSSLYSSLPLKKKHDFPVVFVASAQQEEDNTLVIDEEEEEGGEAELSWGESDGGAAVEAQGSDEGEAEPPEDAKVFVGNLPYDATSAELAGIFEQAGVVYSAEVIYNRETGQSRGFGFVVMETVEEAEKAVEMLSRYALRGRTLTINKASPKGVRPERAPRAYEPSFRIYVGNLPWDVDDARLEQLFSEHGKVVNARVVSDRDTGRSRGFGFVTMSTESELNDAIQNLDGQSINGRPIRVNVAEERQRRGGF